VLNTLLRYENNFMTETARKKYNDIEIIKRYNKVGLELSKHYIKFLLFQSNKKPVTCTGKIVCFQRLRVTDKKFNYILTIRNFKTKKHFARGQYVPLKNIRIYEKNFLQFINSDKVLMNFFQNHLILEEQQQLTKFDFLTM
jgi:hypothetical protein